MAEIDRLFRAMQKAGGSDLLLLQGQPPKYRQAGHVVPIPDEPVLTHALIQKYMQQIAHPAQWKKFMKCGDLDFAYAMGASDPGPWIHSQPGRDL